MQSRNATCVAGTQALVPTQLSPLGLSIEHVLVTTTEAAERLSFRGSPTILIDGIDPFAAGDEPIGLSCRIYLTPHGYEGSPTTAQLAAALAATG